jgi:hypothetical protein
MLQHCLSAPEVVRRSVTSARLRSPRGERVFVERAANGVPAAEAGTGDERRVLNGTFGNRQALDLSSPGPFTHVFDF